MTRIEELISRRRHQILIHSYAYYEMNTNFISDHTYDSWCKELAELQQQYPKESKNVEFYFKEFKDFTGETGFDLPKEPWMHAVCHRLLMYNKEKNE